MTGKRNVIVRIAGAAGDGIASTGELFGKTCSRMGLHVMAYNAYQSAIRGGHVWLQLNVGEDKTLSHGEEPDVALLFNKTSPEVHVPMMKSGGIVFYNATTIKKEDIEAMRDDLQYLGIDFKNIITEAGLNSVSPVMINTMLAGALIQAIGLDTTLSLDFLNEKFAKKGDQVVELNQKIFKLGIEWTKVHFKNADIKLKGDGKRRMFLTGNDAFGMGFAAGGLKLYAAYPMSPASGILHYLAANAHADKIVVKQTEDELAAINYAVGAGNAGVRAATATAGGGFCLMVEGVGLAGMLEVPVVAVCVQRGSPSTGIPTKQEQGDIKLVMGGNGDFPRMVIAPKDVEDAFFQAARALNIAEKYQTPVIIISDLYLSEHYQTVDPFDFSKVTIERGKMARTHEGGDRYKRFLLTEDGISPRVLPGTPGAMYCVGSDEHTEDGELISDILAGLPSSLEIRNKMHEKRMQKEITMIESGDVQAPTLTGDANARITLMGWGSTSDFIEDACRLLRADGLKVNHLHFTDIYPLPKEKVIQIMKSCNRIIAVENNISNQMSKLILSETGFEIKEFINRYDGEPFTGEYIADAVKQKELAHA
jgi:2-oxoglutarate ferredoxin oxidoreductase subunit alpha